LLSLLALIALTGVAAAAKTPATPSGASGVPTSCDLTGYKADVDVSADLSIPDNDATGVTLTTPATAADGSRYVALVVGLEIEHTWIGDLIATVTYDGLCDGVTADDIGVKLLCRPGRASCTGGTGFGYGVGAVCTNTLLFSDGALGPITGAAATVPAGCYRPTGATGSAGPLSAFAGSLKGGCWKLSVSDNAADDVGRICGFSVHSLNENPVPTRPASWGGVKSIYR
jgi:hypothetical protein